MVELKLDTTAVNALFPEGTEARVALQQAVINNITNGIIGKQIPKDIRDMVDAAAKNMGLDFNFQDMVQKELNSYMKNRGWGSSAKELQPTRKSELKSLVEAEIRNIAHDSFEGIVKNCTEEAKKQFEDGMERKIKYALSKTDAHFASRLNENFKQILDAALAQRLGLQVKE